MESSGGALPHLKRVVIGGSACPRATIEAFEERYDVRVRARLGNDRDEPARHALLAQAEVAALDREARYAYQEKQGHPPFGVEMKITDDEGRSCRATARPSDG